MQLYKPTPSPLLFSYYVKNVTVTYGTVFMGIQISFANGCPLKEGKICSGQVGWSGCEHNLCPVSQIIHPFGGSAIVDGLPRWLSSKELACNAPNTGLIPGSGRSPGGGQGNPLQYSCLENPMDRGTWQATVHGVAKSWT